MTFQLALEADDLEKTLQDIYDTEEKMTAHNGMEYAKLPPNQIMFFRMPYGVLGIGETSKWIQQEPYSMIEVEDFLNSELKKRNSPAKIEILRDTRTDSFNVQYVVLVFRLDSTDYTGEPTDELLNI